MGFYSYHKQPGVSPVKRTRGKSSPQCQATHGEIAQRRIWCVSQYPDPQKHSPWPNIRLCCWASYVTPNSSSHSSEHYTAGACHEECQASCRPTSQQKAHPEALLWQVEPPTLQSYIVQADGKNYRRNRHNMLPVAEPPSPQLVDDPDQQDNSPPTVDSSPPHKCQHHTRCNHNTHHHPSSSPKRPHPLRFKTHNTPHTQVAPANQIPNTCEKRKKKKRRKNNPIYPACLILGHLMKLNSLSV